MKTLRSVASPRRCFAAFLASALIVSAQTPAPAPTKAATEETILLNPFDVTAGSTKGYMATNTLSGTAINTPLTEVPMAINVITAEFLADSLVGDFAPALDDNSAITQTSRLPVSNRNDAFALRGFRNRHTLVDGVSTGEFVAPIMVGASSSCRARTPSPARPIPAASSTSSASTPSAVSHARSPGNPATTVSA